MGFSVMLWGAEKLVPVEYWCPYGTSLSHILIQAHKWYTKYVLSKVDINVASADYGTMIDTWLRKIFITDIHMN